MSFQSNAFQSDAFQEGFEEEVADVVHRLPLVTRLWRVSAAAALSAVSLGSPAALLLHAPVAPKVWDNPVRRVAPAQPSNIQNLLTSTLEQAEVIVLPPAWGVATQKRLPQSEVCSSSPALLSSVQAPFVPPDWANPVVRRAPLAEPGSSPLTSTLIAARPFAQLDWPNPAPRRGQLPEQCPSLLGSTLAPTGTPVVPIEWANPRAPRQAHQPRFHRLPTVESQVFPSPLVPVQLPEPVRGVPRLNGWLQDAYAARNTVEEAPTLLVVPPATGNVPAARRNPQDWAQAAFAARNTAAGVPASSQLWPNPIGPRHAQPQHPVRDLALLNPPTEPFEPVVGGNVPTRARQGTFEQFSSFAARNTVQGAPTRTYDWPVVRGPVRVQYWLQDAFAARNPVTLLVVPPSTNSVPAARRWAQDWVQDAFAARNTAAPTVPPFQAQLPLPRGRVAQLPEQSPRNLALLNPQTEPFEPVVGDNLPGRRWSGGGWLQDAFAARNTPTDPIRTYDWPVVRARVVQITFEQDAYAARNSPPGVPLVPVDIPNPRGALRAVDLYGWLNQSPINFGIPDPPQPPASTARSGVIRLALNEIGSATGKSKKRLNRIDYSQVGRKLTPPAVPPKPPIEVEAAKPKKAAAKPRKIKVDQTLLAKLDEQDLQDLQDLIELIKKVL